MSNQSVWTKWHIEQVVWYFLDNPDKWTNDDSPPFAGIDLSDADLSRADLRSADLRSADLRSADLSRADLSRANLRSADLSRANLRSADLRSANLSRADLSRADLSDANLRSADLRSANLSRADLSDANLSHANLSDTNLSDANLSDANLSDANLSRAAGILSSIDYLDAHFEKSDDGYIAYKTFGQHYSPNLNWTIEPGAILSEVVNPDRGTLCGCGVNVAHRKWGEFDTGRDLWKVLIRWQWLAGVVVPFHTDGKIRCERVELVEIVRE